MAQAEVANVITDRAVIEQARRESRYVPVHRPTKWGNPYVIGRDGTREEVIEKYRLWIKRMVGSMPEKLEELRGKVLGCYCSPLPCHAGVLVEMLEEKNFA